MLTSDEPAPVRGNAHAHVEKRGAMPMLMSDETTPVHGNAHAHVQMQGALPMLRSDGHLPVRGNAHAHVRRDTPGPWQCPCSRPTSHRWTALMPMLTSDETPPVRANAHAHVEARARTGREMRAVERSQRPCSCPMPATKSRRRGARPVLSPPKVNRPPGRSGEFREFKRYTSFEN